MSFSIVAGLVALGILAGMVLAPVRAQSLYASIGFVDLETALTAHPSLDSVMTQISQFQDAKIAELDQYGDNENLTDEQRQQMMEDIYRLQSEVEDEKQRLTEPLIQDIIDATTAVGEESGIEVILEAGSVMWGGLDLTPLIVQRITGS